MRKTVGAYVECYEHDPLTDPLDLEGLVEAHGMNMSATQGLKASEAGKVKEVKQRSQV